MTFGNIWNYASASSGGPVPQHIDFRVWMRNLADAFVAGADSMGERFTYDLDSLYDLDHYVAEYMGDDLDEAFADSEAMVLAAFIGEVLVRLRKARWVQEGDDRDGTAQEPRLALAPHGEETVSPGDEVTARLDVGPPDRLTLFIERCMDREDYEDDEE